MNVGGKFFPIKNAMNMTQHVILIPVYYLRMLEIYPRGRNSHDAEHLSFVLRNVTTRPQRATFHMYVRYRVAFQSSREDYAYKLAAESPFAAILEPSGCRSDQWAHDTSIAYADIIDPNLGYLHNGNFALGFESDCVR